VLKANTLLPSAPFIICTMATCIANIETSGSAWSSTGCSGKARMTPPCIDLMASDQVSGPAVCFQIGTPTSADGDCHFIGTPTREGFKLKDEDVDECFECDDSDSDCSRVSDDDSECESEADTEASPICAPPSVATGKKLSWDDVADRNTRVRSISPPMVEVVSQEPNWKLEAACHLAGRKGFGGEADSDSDFDDSDDDSDYMGGRRDNFDDDFEIGSAGSDSDREL